MPPCPPRPPRAIRRALLLLVGPVLVLAGMALAAGPAPLEGALAEVQHHQGFSATVLGWTSWYGSYGMGDLGVGWCVDHGLRAPDAAFGYVPASIEGETDPATRAALSWAATDNASTDPVSAAAVMLAIHDLRGATYPQGRLDLGALSPDRLAGFGGHEAEVLDRARAVKSAALAHAHLRGDLHLALDPLPPVVPGDGTLHARVADDLGQPVPDATVAVVGLGPVTMIGPTVGRTDAGGGLHVPFSAGAGTITFRAEVWAPHPEPEIYAPTAADAQRIIRPHVAHDAAEVALAPPPPTTPAPTPPPTTAPPTTAPPTTAPPTTAPSTTTTSAPTTSTTRAPVTSTTSTTTLATTTTSTPSTTTPTTSTTAGPVPTTTAPPPSATPDTTTPTPPDSAPSTTAGHETTTSTSPVPAAAATPVRGALPLTGTATLPWALIGSGLAVAGSGLAAEARARVRRLHEHGDAGRARLGRHVRGPDGP